jgi:hypothetical protein
MLYYLYIGIKDSKVLFIQCMLLYLQMNVKQRLVLYGFFYHLTDPMNCSLSCFYNFRCFITITSCMMRHYQSWQW